MEREVERKWSEDKSGKTEYLKFNVIEGGNLYLQNKQLKEIEAFRYLESHISRDGDLDKEIDYRI